MKRKNIFISFLVLVFLEIFNTFTFWGKSFWLFFGISVVFLIVVILWGVGLPFKKWFSIDIVTHSVYLVLPIIFYVSNLFFLLFIQNRIFKQIFIFSSIILLFIILMGIRGVILNLEHQIKPRLTYNFLVLSTIWTSFLIYSVIWAFFRDLNLPIWLIILIFFIVNSLLFYQIFHLFGIFKKCSLIYASFSAFIISQIVWVLCFWPLEYFLAGVLLTIIFYTLWGLIHHYLENTLTRKLVIEYLIFAVIIFFIILKKSIIF